MNSLGMAVLLRAAADDLLARIERNALRALLPFVRRNFRGELVIDVAPDGSVEVVDTVRGRPDSRFQHVYVDDQTAGRLLLEAAELGLS
jgi:hypothetical protein